MKIFFNKLVYLNIFILSMIFKSMWSFPSLSINACMNKIERKRK